MSDTADMVVAPEFVPARPKKRRKQRADLVLKRAKRREMVVELKSAGLSWRAIGKKLGVSGVTARNDYMDVVKNVDMSAKRKAAKLARYNMTEKLLREWIEVFSSEKNLDRKALAHDKIISAATFQAKLLGLDLSQKGAVAAAQHNVSVTVSLDKPLQSLDHAEREQLIGKLDDMDESKEVGSAMIEDNLELK